MGTEVCDKEKCIQCHKTFCPEESILRTTSVYNVTVGIDKQTQLHRQYSTTFVVRLASLCRFKVY